MGRVSPVPGQQSLSTRKMRQTNLSASPSARACWNPRWRRLDIETAAAKKHAKLEHSFGSSNVCMQAPTQGPCLRFQTHTAHVPAAVTAAAPSSSRGLLHQHPACAPSTSYSQAASPLALPVRHAASGLQCRNAGAKGRHVAAASGSASIGAAGGDSSRGGSNLSLPERIIAFQQAFWKFLRPHTIRGTVGALGAQALCHLPVHAQRVRNVAALHHLCKNCMAASSSQSNQPTALGLHLIKRPGACQLAHAQPHLRHV
jgi:hypothetical protein